MQQSRLSVSETLAEVGQRRPALLSAFNTFEDLLTARASIAADLLPLSDAESQLLPQWDPQRAAQGQSLLSDWSLQGWDDTIHRSAVALLPSIVALAPFRSDREKLEDIFLSPQQTTLRSTLLTALLESNEEAFLNGSAQADMAPDTLEFPAEFVLSAVLRALSSSLPERPWETSGQWKYGYCPICGSLPILSWLDRPQYDEKNAYLLGGGGKKFLYCGVCSTKWRFRRGVCPACNAEGEGAIEILKEHGSKQGERLDWCTKCKSYCPSLDLRECAAIPDMDAAALGMLHMDIVAAQKNLSPLRLSFWNQFNFS